SEASQPNQFLASPGTRADRKRLHSGKPAAALLAQPRLHRPRHGVPPKASPAAAAKSSVAVLLVPQAAYSHNPRRAIPFPAQIPKAVSKVHRVTFRAISAACANKS